MGTAGFCNRKLASDVKNGRQSALLTLKDLGKEERARTTHYCTGAPVRVLCGTAQVTVAKLPTNGHRSPKQQLATCTCALENNSHNAQHTTHNIYTYISDIYIYIYIYYFIMRYNAGCCGYCIMVRCMRYKHINACVCVCV